eukprot:CAMPEP_0175404984 /NCGR_PEP_ID=MMETSP0095-20121207/38818_1 /TAXON_ID=311494 /ORGANISM="Alexandrium monilatum, Strain CCMP3105" /LENGTH=184 /DNA_ID=CAMNT_0016703807 /DNA_START=61 /DNA_END=613 /DNA_ORIENTATION=-
MPLESAERPPLRPAECDLRANSEMMAAPALRGLAPKGTTNWCNAPGMSFASSGLTSSTFRLKLACEAAQAPCLLGCGGGRLVPLATPWALTLARVISVGVVASLAFPGTLARMSRIIMLFLRLLLGQPQLQARSDLLDGVQPVREPLAGPVSAGTLCPSFHLWISRHRSERCWRSQVDSLPADN